MWSTVSDSATRRQAKTCQLPPTSFFTTNQVDEEHFDQEDLESVLDDCLAISMPEEHLLWHYRSRHESLIAFSNMRYYDNKLYTFPSPNDLESKVSFVQVKGCYDRGRTKQNRAEAEAVVEEILRRLNDPELQKDSIGVVTFSSAQQNLIEDLLTEAFDRNPRLEAVNNAAEEPIFIKNLVNHLIIFFHPANLCSDVKHKILFVPRGCCI